MHSKCFVAYDGSDAFRRHTKKVRLLSRGKLDWLPSNFDGGDAGCGRHS